MHCIFFFFCQRVFFLTVTCTGNLLAAPFLPIQAGFGGPGLLNFNSSRGRRVRLGGCRGKHCVSQNRFRAILDDSSRLDLQDCPPTPPTPPPDPPTKTLTVWWRSSLKVIKAQSVYPSVSKGMPLKGKFRFLKCCCVEDWHIRRVFINGLQPKVHTTQAVAGKKSRAETAFKGEILFYKWFLFDSVPYVNKR